MTDSFREDCYSKPGYYFPGPRHLFRTNMILEKLENFIQPGSCILDAGSGDGSLCIKLAGKGCKAMGIDLSKTAIAKAQQRIRQTGLEDRISLVRGDITRISFINDYFDGIVCGEVLEHIPNHVAAIQELYRVLKPGGYCIITVPVNPKLWGETDESVGHVRRYEKDELELLFTETGFIVDECHYWGFPLVRLYDTYFRPRLVKSEGVMNEQSKIAIIVSIILSKLFMIDRIFDKSPLGAGLILMGRK